MGGAITAGREVCQWEGLSLKVVRCVTGRGQDCREEGVWGRH